MRKINKKVLWIIVISIFLFFPDSSVQAKFIKSFAVRIGGDNLKSGDEVRLAKYDIVLANKFHYDDINGDSWGAMKAINPNVKIYLYTIINYVNSTHDAYGTVYLNELGRYGVSRGHSMGSLNGDNQDFFLLNSGNNRVVISYDTNRYLLDFGSSSFRKYSSEATINDHVGQPWTADGVFSDHCWVIMSDTNSTPVRYNTDSTWSSAMNGMIDFMTAALHDEGQKFAANRGLSFTESGYNAWLALDNVANPPDSALEEAGFVIKYGGGDVQFFPEYKWKREVDIMSNVSNYNVLNFSHTDIGPGGSGTDNWGKDFTFWDALWFALGSYSIAKNDVDDNSYFGFGVGNYSTLSWFDEYDAMDGGNLDLGSAVGTYKISNINGVNIYWRAFERGYVYVNPTPDNASSISLPELCKELNYTNFKNDLTNIPDKNTISLNAHRAVFLYKSNAGLDPSSDAPFPPKGLIIR